MTCFERNINIYEEYVWWDPKDSFNGEIICRAGSFSFWLLLLLFSHIIRSFLVSSAGGHKN